MFWYEILIIIAVLALDLGSKYGIVNALGIQHVDGEFVQTKSDIEFIKNFISFSYTENTGATFGSFKGKTELLTAITAIGMVLLIIFLFFNKKENKFFRTCLVLILAGGLGNLYDRIVFGYVRDFIVFDFWPSFATFNVADSFLTVSTILVVIYAVFFMPKKVREEQEKKELADKTAPVAYPYDALKNEEIVTGDDSSDKTKDVSPDEKI
ncbi:MAG: signal peptidase II [Eubacteriales bacterium]|nr:signal peptidase II [Eubacteriales bacterium]